MILYNGILTKNIHENDLKNKKGLMGDIIETYKSKSCQEIIENL